jgi:hypothetical protein
MPGMSANLDQKLVKDLVGRSLAEWAVFMTICGIGAFIISMLFAAVVRDVTGLSGIGLFSVSAMVWSGLMAWLWYHFYQAARSHPLTNTSTGVFYLVQAAAYVPCVAVLLKNQIAGQMMLVVIMTGMEIAVCLFYGSYFFLARSLARPVPISAWIGFAVAVTGVTALFIRFDSLLEGIGR